MHKLLCQVFEERDLEKINLRKEDVGRELEDFKRCDSYSFYDNSQILGILGVIKINDYTCEVNMVLDKAAEHCIRTVLEVSRWLLDDLLDHYVRIQAPVRADWTRSRRYVERLGFVCEGVLRSFAPDGDYCIYARVK